MQAVHFQVHTPEQVREIIDRARGIANDIALDDAKWEPIFVKACDLLGARATMIAQPNQVPFDLSKIRAGNAA